MKVDVTCEVFPDESFRGDVFRIHPTIDNATKTFTVEIRVPNTGMKLRPGMFARVSVNLDKGQAILVPAIALIKQTGTSDMYVFVHKNGIARKVPVKTGYMLDDKIEIIEGVSEGDEVIIVGQNKLEDQVPVRVIK
jgi:membrane fusion protein, multidrug efflux system